MRRRRGARIRFTPLSSVPRKPAQGQALGIMSLRAPVQFAQTEKPSIPESSVFTHTHSAAVDSRIVWLPIPDGVE